MGQLLAALIAVWTAATGLIITHESAPITQNHFIIIDTHRGPWTIPIWCTASYVLPPDTVMTSAHCGPESANFIHDPNVDIAYWHPQHGQALIGNTTTKLKSYDDIVDGEPVCVYSRIMHKRSCGHVYKKTIDNPFFEERHLTDLVLRFDDPFPMVWGDSGVPVTSPDGSTLIGVFSDFLDVPYLTAASVGGIKERVEIQHASDESSATHGW